MEEKKWEKQEKMEQRRLEIENYRLKMDTEIAYNWDMPKIDRQDCIYV